VPAALVNYAPPVNFAPATSAAPYFQWSALTYTNGAATPVLTRFFDAIFNYLNQAYAPQNTNLIEPYKLARYCEVFNYPEDFNLPKKLEKIGRDMSFPQPTQYANQALALMYRIYSMAHITTVGGPSLTREGFYRLLTNEVLVDPDSACYRFNSGMTRLGATLLDPATGRPFQQAQIPRQCFPPIPDAKAKALDLQLAQQFGQQLNGNLMQAAGIQQRLNEVAVSAIAPGRWVYKY
jgi:hypothetical protein